MSCDTQYSIFVHPWLPGFSLFFCVYGVWYVTLLLFAATQYFVSAHLSSSFSSAIDLFLQTIYPVLFSLYFCPVLQICALNSLTSCVTKGCKSSLVFFVTAANFPLKSRHHPQLALVLGGFTEQHLRHKVFFSDPYSSTIYIVQSCTLHSLICTVAVILLLLCHNNSSLF